MVNGRAGVYQVMNVVEKEEMSVEQFWTDSQKLENQRSKRELQASLNGDYDALQRSFWSNIRCVVLCCSGINSMQVQEV